MIIAPTPAFYVIKVEGETAQAVASDLSPAVAADIENAILMSNEFEIDIVAVNSFDSAISHIEAAAHVGDEMQKQVEWNPLYTTAPIAALDEMLNHDAQAESMKFIGMDGNMFTFKAVHGKINDTPVIEGRVNFKPFDIPAYSDIVQAKDTRHLN